MSGDKFDVFMELISDEYKHDYKTAFNFNVGTQRLGQAFFNALPFEMQARLRGTIHDTFYANSWKPILDAIDFLTTK